ncbi:MAG: redoxin family protein [Polyangiaceae bacterium]
MELTRIALALFSAGIFGALVPACAPARAPGAVAPIELVGTDGKSHPLVDPNAKVTVVEFFSAHCPCQAKHDERLRALAETYGARGVAFAIVDSEFDAAVDRDRIEAELRKYAFPILIDPDGAVAKKMGADYATYTLVVDHSGNVLFSGGIDSDKTHLTEGATPYLRDALDDALAGRPVRLASAKTLGCALTLR